MSVVRLTDETPLPAQGFTALQWLSVVLSLPLLVPILAIAWLAATADLSAWPHLAKTVLPSMAWQTLLFCGGTALFTLAIGLVMAWLVTFYSFTCRNLLKWSAILPLAIPGYITSFAYVDSFSYAGPVQGFVRGLMGWKTPSESWIPEIRSMGGAIFMMSFALYPYVYMAARAAFLRQPMAQLDVARTLGRSPWQAFLQITLPQARPALAVGMSLVIMECLNDIGAAQFFGVNTLTLGIYSTWLGQGNLGGAAQLAFVLLLAVAALILFEQFMRNRDGLSRNARTSASVQRVKLQGMRAASAFMAMFIPIFLGFLLPLILLFGYARRQWGNLLDQGFLSDAGNSLLLAALACFGTLGLALLLGHAARNSGSRAIKGLSRFASLGYALPGTVLGIGIVVPFGMFDNALNAFLSRTFGVTPGLLLSGSLIALTFAYVTRFLIIATGLVEAGFAKISPHLDQVARTLGRSPFAVFREIHLPMLQPSLMAAALLVFVDAMKELPATLLLRPFDFDTLATRVFTLASLGQLEESAVPAIAIVAAGLVPVFILSRNLRDPARI